MKNQIRDSKKYNDKRSELLLKKDNNEEVNNLELCMYGLTPYLTASDFDTNLTNKIIFSNLESKPVLHVKENIYFMDEQVRVLKLFKEHNRMILMAPTSFGKTLLVKEFIYTNQFKSVVVIVPTNSLAYELEKSFKDNNKFKNYKIFNSLKNNGFDDNVSWIFIGTQEKYLEVEDFIKNTDLFVIDEAYKLKDNLGYQRNYRLSKVFLDNAIKKSTKILLLSPNAHFEGFDDYNFYTEYIDFNAVEKSYKIIGEDIFYDEVNAKSKNDKTILYCKTPGDINSIVDKIEYKNDILQKYAEFLADEFHSEWSVVKLLKKGVLVHHGQMPKFVQNKMQNLFINNDDCKLIIGTNSISEGINTPAKNIFISPSFTDRDDTMLIKNTVGRAGRLGIYPIGHIYSTKQIEEECKKELYIKLAISNDESMSEISDSKNDVVIDSLSETQGIDSSNIKYILKNFSISISKLKVLFEIFKKDQKFSSYSNLVYFGSEVFSYDYMKYKIKLDVTLLKCYLLSFTSQDGKYISLDSFDNKITYITIKSGLSLGEAVDEYMSFIYSRLEYCILPIAKIAMFIKEKCSGFVFGKFVYESCADFIKRYYFVTYGELDINDFNNDEIKIIGILREFGVSFKRVNIKKELINEILNLLDNEFASYDVIKAIETFSQIIEKY